MTTPPAETSPATREAPALPAWVSVLCEKVAPLRYGSVQIVVHEGRVSQIEFAERIRFPFDRDALDSACL